MRLKPLIFAGALAVGAAAYPAINLNAANNETRTVLASVPAVELPHEVAALIQAEKGQGRNERCVAILRTGVELNHAAAPAIVGAACRVAPDLAPQFSAAAALIEPKLAAGIARAAAAAVPTLAPEIAVAVVKSRPAEYAQVAYEVAYAVPGKDEQVVSAITTGLPNLKPFTSSSSSSTASITDLVASTGQVDKAARQLGMKTEDFVVAQLTVEQSTAVKALASAGFAPAVAGGNPAQKGVPFVPGAGTPGEQNRAQPVVVTPGQGRTYDKPGNGPK